MRAHTSFHGKFKNYGYVHVDEFSKEWEKAILKQIKHINFTKLTLIGLDGNKLTSIEGLTRVRMPHLQSLGLGTILVIQDTTTS